MINDQLKQEFPNLIQTGYEITSPESTEYNCIAWAAGESDCWWWPDPMETSYWPGSVERTVTLKSFIKAFETLSYTICDGSEYEAGYEKIAIYADANNRPTHAARQLDNNTWTSKLGQSYDISHVDNGLSESQAYGDIAVIMKRKID